MCMYKHKQISGGNSFSYANNNKIHLTQAFELYIYIYNYVCTISKITRYNNIADLVSKIIDDLVNKHSKCCTVL